MLRTLEPAEAGLHNTFTRAKALLPDLKALVFDLDGTLVDPMELHFRAYQQVLSDLGGLLSRSDFEKIVGPPAEITIPSFVRAAGLDPARLPPMVEIHARKKRAFATIIAGQPPQTLPAADLLREMCGTFAIAVVTSGNRNGAEAILGAIGLAGVVTALVTGDDVKQGKPAPYPYALGLSSLACRADEAIAFEDHDDGILSATRAGLMVIDVRTSELVTP